MKCLNDNINLDVKDNIDFNKKDNVNFNKKAYIKLSRKDYIKIVLKGCVILFIISYLFFNNIFLAFCFSPYIIYYIKKNRIIYDKKQKAEFKVRFFEAMDIVAGYIKTGMSIQKSLVQALTDIRLLYGINSEIYKEIDCINTSIELDILVEEAINNLAKKKDIKEINEFAKLFEVSIQRDGNVVKVIESMCAYIRDEIEMDRQVRISINSVLQEINIMKLMPVAILAYLRIFSSEYIECIYKDSTGLLIMAVVLISYIVVLYVIDKMKQKILIWESV
jgi:tight adherence protein B